MRLLITGASGLLGGNLAFLAAAAGHEVHATYHTHPVGIAGCRMWPLDLGDGRQIAHLVTSTRPDAVVHAAAMTDPDACEANRSAAWRVNVQATQHVAAACRRIEARLVTISTDLVFDGRKGWYAEEDEANPLSTYGQTKLEAERRALGANPEACCVRTALIYGWSVRPGKPSASEWILDALRAGRPVRLFTDQYRTPILVNNLCEAILEICGSDLRGLVHLGGAQRISRYEFGRALAGVYGFGEEHLVPAVQDEVPLVAPRPRDCSLDTARARAALGVRLLDVAAGLRRLKELEDGGYVARLRG